MRFHLTAAIAFLAVLAAALWVFAASASSESTPEIGRAIQAVQQEVELAQLGLQQQHTAAPAGYLAAVAALDYTTGHVLSGVYGYREVHNQPLPNTAEEILAAQAGICGHATIVFREILTQLGYQTRAVGFTVKGGSHATAEVLYDGRWHWFDPTFGVYYRQAGNVLTIAQARALKTPQRFAVIDQTLLWRQVMGQTAWATRASGMGLPLSDATISYG
jgi:hypothetical protein